MKVWLTSDEHYNHFNIINYQDRPFKDLEAMNSTLIKNHNARVKKGDIVMHLGDFIFRNTKGGKEGEGGQDRPEYFINQLNGYHTFTKGSHDKNNSLNAVIKHFVIEHGGQEIFCVHNPEECNTKYKINLVGHVHKAWKVKRIKNTILVNCGVDVWNFHPIDINEIMAAISAFNKGELNGELK